MEIKYYRKSQIKYPIGENITHNISIIKKMAKAIISLNNENICLCCRGSSGAIIAGIIASLLPKHYSCSIAHIKKEGEFSHFSGFYIPDNAFVVIVDDFIISGKTINSIYENIISSYPSVDIGCLCVDYISPDKNKINFTYKHLIVGTYE